MPTLESLLEAAPRKMPPRITPEVLQARAELLYGRISPSNPEKMLEIKAYEDYLETSLHLLHQEASVYEEEDFHVTADELFHELRFWDVDRFVWPFIFSNGEGGIVFLWTANSLVLRFERSAQAVYTIERYHEDSETNFTPTNLTQEELLGEVVPQGYQQIVKELWDSGVDWKRLLNARTAKIRETVTRAAQV